MQPFFPASFLEIRVDQFPKRCHRHERHGRRILGQRQKAVFRRHTRFRTDKGRLRLPRDVADHLCKRIPQSGGAFLHSTGGFSGCTIRHFPGNDRRNTEKVAHDELLRGTIRSLLCRQSVEGAFIDGQRIGLILRGRHFIQHPGQHLSLFTRGEVDTFEHTDDLVVYIGDDDVGKFAHNFGDDVLLGREAEIVVGVEGDPCRAFKAKLFDGGYARPCEMLPQHHTEHGRHRWIFDLVMGQVHTGTGGSGRQQKSMLPTGTADHKNDLLFSGLVNLIDLAADQSLATFPYHAPEHTCVKCHTVPPPRPHRRLSADRFCNRPAENGCCTGQIRLFRQGAEMAGCRYRRCISRPFPSR